MDPRVWSIIPLFFLVLNSNAQKPGILLFDFNHKYPQEKIYLHLDKDVYVAGETIWFKAYLLSDLLPDTISSSIFIDMLDVNGKLVFRRSLPVFNSTASANIDLPDSLPYGYYIMQAYTSWMLNFDPGFFYTKRVFIYNNSST